MRAYSSFFFSFFLTHTIAILSKRSLISVWERKPVKLTSLCVTTESFASNFPRFATEAFVTLLSGCRDLRAAPVGRMRTPGLCLRGMVRAKNESVSAKKVREAMWGNSSWHAGQGRHWRTGPEPKTEQGAILLVLTCHLKQHLLLRGINRITLWSGTAEIDKWLERNQRSVVENSHGSSSVAFINP